MMDMPTPDRTSLEAIVLAAGELLESDGLAGLTMNSVAQRVGVRPPSLYKRIEDRDGLIRLVAEATLSELAARLQSQTTVEALARTFRSFAHERPAAFQLVMTPGPGTPVAAPTFGAAAAQPILRAAAGLVGESDALVAARTLTAWAAGFISMELNGGFQLGGDVDEAWEFGLSRIVAAIRAPRAAPAATRATG